MRQRLEITPAAGTELRSIARCGLVRALSSSNAFRRLQSSAVWLLMHASDSIIVVQRGRGSLSQGLLVHEPVTAGAIPFSLAGSVQSAVVHRCKKLTSVLLRSNDFGIVVWAMPRRVRARRQVHTPQSVELGPGSPLDSLPDEVILQVRYVAPADGCSSLTQTAPTPTGRFHDDGGLSCSRLSPQTFDLRASAVVSRRMHVARQVDPWALVAVLTAC